MYSKTVWILCALVGTWWLILSPCLADEKEAGKPPPPQPGETQSRVVFVKHADCEELAKAVRVLFQVKGERYRAAFFAPAQAILLRGSPEEVKQMEAIIAQSDVPASAQAPAPTPPQELAIIPLQYAKAGDVLHLVKEMIARPGSRRARPSSSTPAPRYAVDERTNVIILLATQDQITRVNKLVTAVDVPIAHTGSNSPKGK